MKICVDAASLHPPLTGVGNYTRNVIAHLPDLCPDATFLYFNGHGWHDRPGIQPQAIAPSSPGRLRAIATRISCLRPAWRQFRKIAWSMAPRAPSPTENAVCLAPNFLPPGPFRVVVPVVHDLSFIRHPETHPQERLNWLAGLPAILAAAPRIVVVSPFTAEEVRTYYRIPADRLHIAPPGVSAAFRTADRADPSAAHRYGLVPGQYILSVATLEPRKNLSTLVEAYAALPEAIRRLVPLVMVGALGWGDIGRSALWGELERCGQIRILGYVPDDALAGLYANARALCCPSLYEGFGMPVAEALATGTPVLVSATSALPDTAGPGGLILPPRETGAWTEALSRIIGDDQLHDRLGRAGREHVRAFDWRRSAATIVRALAEAAAIGPIRETGDPEI